MKKSSITPMFVVLSGLFVSCLMLSNIVAGKLVSIFGITLTAAVVLFPVTYIFGDVLTEVYGFKRARLIIWIGFGCNLLMVLVFWMTLAMPYPEFWRGQEAYSLVLGTTPRIVAASLIAYLAGSFSNSIVLSKLKVITSGRWLWVRTISSTVVGEGVDSLIFITLSFYGTLPGPALIQMIIAQYIFKVLYEIVATPLTYLVVGWIKRKEEIDAYDYGVIYNPFGIREDL